MNSFKKNISKSKIKYIILEKNNNILFNKINII